MERKPSQVVLAKGQRSLETVKRALGPLDVLQKLSDKPVLIKVNFITTKTWDTGATTDPIIVEALIQEIRKVNDRIFVVESDATVTRADKAAETTGMLELCRRYGIQFLNLSKIREKTTVKIPNSETLRDITVPSLVLRSHVVSAAKMKTHGDTTVTLGLKNMFGLLPDRFKGKYHLKGIEKVIVDINAVLRPSLVVIDGFVAMEGYGPVSGDPVRMDLVTTGVDPVATDATAARIMGFDPNRIYHIRRSHEKGLGELDHIEIHGERLEDVRRVFKPP